MLQQSSGRCTGISGGPECSCGRVLDTKRSLLSVWTSHTWQQPDDLCIMMALLPAARLLSRAQVPSPRQLCTRTLHKPFELSLLLLMHAGTERNEIGQHNLLCTGTMFYSLYSHNSEMNDDGQTENTANKLFITTGKDSTRRYILHKLINTF